MFRDLMNKRIQNWIDYIKSNDPNRVTELYDEHALLLGTFSDIERQGPKLIYDYFNGLLSSKVDVEIVSEHTHNFDNLEVCSGLYNFIVNGDMIEARYSFVFIQINDVWKILSHHSSVLPKSS